MTKAVAALRVLALLLGTWAVLLLIAHFAGVLPAFPWEGEEDAAPIGELDAGGVDAGVEPAVAEAPEAQDAGVVGAAAPGDVPSEALTSYVACPSSSLAPTLAPLAFLGRGAELVVGCGRETHVLAIDASGGGLAPVRVATLRLAAEGLRAEPEGAAVVGADANGDGLVDLVVGHLVPASRNAAQQGTLAWVPRDTRGGLDAPITLGPIAVASIAAADLDGAPGAELVALHQADRFGRRPSEAWVFGGGASPARTTRLDAGATARVVRIVDLDRDGRLDVVTLADGDPGGRVYFGDGTGRFPRNQPLVVAGARDAAVGDVDGDGADDLVLTGDSVRLVSANGDPAQIAARTLDVPADASKLHVVDVDADGRADLVGIAGGGVTVLAQTEPLRFEPRPLLDVPLASGTITALVMAQLGGADALDLALLVDAPGDARGYELVLVLDPEAHAIVSLAAEPTPIRDAPLTLEVDLR